MAQLTIAVLAYNSPNMTAECLKSIDRLNLHAISTKKLLIDNGSVIPLSAPYNWDVIRTSENWGNVGGQNMCLSNSKTPWVLFVSNDVRLEEGCIEALWQEKFQGQLMPIIMNKDLSIQSYGGRLKWPGYGFNIMRRSSCKDCMLDYVPSICYLMPVDLWTAIGKFDEDYPSAYEDVDMGIRLGSHRLRCSLKAFAIHLGNATLGFKNNSSFVEGRKRLVNKHYKGVDRIARLSAVKALSYIPSHPPKVVGDGRVV